MSEPTQLDDVALIHAPARPVVAQLQAMGDDREAAKALRDHYLDRIETLEPHVRAFASLDLARARAASMPEGPLCGLPIGIKDIIETADFPTRCGSPIHADRHTGRDADVVAAVRRAGGSIPGKTVTTEFAFFTPGPTRNPWNVNHTPGGSSSGSAAAVAAGMLPFAIGTQTTGSVVRPAAFCGVAGYKPTFGMVSRAGVLSVAPSLDTVGFFAPCVADVTWFASLVTGHNLQVANDRPLVFGRVVTHLGSEASPAMRAAVALAQSAVETAGARIVDLDWPQALIAADLVASRIQNAEAARSLADAITHHRDQLSDRLLAGLDEGAAVSDAQLDAARALREPARAAFAALMAGCDALILPAAPGAAPLGLGTTGVPLFNRLWTMIGAPAVNVPGLFDDHGLPLGVQVVAAPGQDAGLLAAAQFVEKALLPR